MSFMLPHPLIWWFTGLPGAGKSTLGAALAAALRGRHQPVCVIDGDVLRFGLSRDLDYSAEGRAENVRRAAEMARLVQLSGIHTVVCLVSPFAKDRADARNILGARSFLEVHVSTPLHVCMARDPKGLYARATAGQVELMTGVSSAYEVPQTPALCIDTSQTPLSEALEQLLALNPNTDFAPGGART